MSKLWMKDNKLLIKNKRLLLADECCCGGGDDEPGCDPGQPDPLCSNCICSKALANTYTVMLSGIPGGLAGDGSTCGYEVFNGTWTLTWTRDCDWEYWIDEWRVVRLWCQNGPFWHIVLSVPIGYMALSFGGISYDEDEIPGSCAPENYVYYPWSCSSSGCLNLCNPFYEGGAATLIRG